MVDFLDYTVSEVIGRNLYSFLHAQDVKSMRHRHLDSKLFTSVHHFVDLVKLEVSLAVTLSAKSVTLK